MENLENYNWEDEITPRLSEAISADNFENIKHYCPQPKFDGVTPLTPDDLMAVCKAIYDTNEVTEGSFKFAPRKLWGAIIDNEEYDPEGFSQEIEDSEKDMYIECNEFWVKHCHCVWGWDSKENEEKYDKMQNSPKWKKNHTKQYPRKAIMLRDEIGITQSYEYKITFGYHSENDEYKKREIRWRDYRATYPKLLEWYNSLKEKGINVYNIW